jgi:enterochelin esterase family protein
MGGAQTLEIMVAHLADFGYVGVFSSGVLGGNGASAIEDWGKAHAARLDNKAARANLSLLWFSTGKDDFLLDTTKATVALFERHGFAPKFEESTGGHTWINWRNYLDVFAPQLFK